MLSLAICPLPATRLPAAPFQSQGFRLNAAPSLTFSAYEAALLIFLGSRTSMQRQRRVLAGPSRDAPPSPHGSWEGSAPEP